VSRADERSTRLSPWLRRPGERPFVLGHRGARHAAPENTMMAFDLALSEGADGIELDVRLDGDDRVIVLHDRTLERVSEGRESRTAETDVITWARERTARVNVELKRDVAKPWALIEGVVRAARAAGNSEELLLFSSFHPAFVATLAVLLPNHARAWLVHEKQRVLGRAPGYRLLGADGVHPQHSLITQRTLARWKRQPALVNAWTVNAGDEARRLAALGVDGIVSDNPGTILQALSEAG
jgi:glycerophosphoryl diester phosphodiesterase